MLLLPRPAARQAALRLAAGALALTAVGGCTSSGDVSGAPASPPRQPPVGAAATTSPGAELQAGLTALLVERTYLVAAATDAITAAGGETDTSAPAAALAALHTGSVALADVLGATYSEARRPLLDALRREDRLLAEHASALGRRDAPAAREARQGLEQAQAELAQVVRRVVPTLDAPQVAERLGADVQAQLPPRSYERLRATATSAAGTARLLADGIARDRDLASPGTGAARLRAEVTGLLTEHVALVGALARELRTPSARSQSARSALQENATALAGVLGEAYPAAQSPFLRSWSAHLIRLERYAAGRAAGSPAEAGTVRSFAQELGRLLAQHVQGLPAQSSGTELEAALDAQLAAVDAAADPDAPQVLRRAVAEVLPAAALVAAAMAEDLRLA